MSKTTARPLAAFFGVITISLIGPVPLAARSLDALQSHNPAHETAAPADAGFAASCRVAARELLGKGSFNFERPAYTSRGGEGIVRMDVSVPGLPRDGLFRAVCVRDRQAGTVEAAIFDAPADDIGPRVIALAGPAGGGQPAAPPHVIAFNPSGPDLAYRDYYGDYYGGGVPGLAAPFCPGCFGRSRAHKPRDVSILRRDVGIELRLQPGVALRGGPTRPARARARADFGVVRMGMGGFVR